MPEIVKKDLAQIKRDSKCFCLARFGWRCNSVD